jgi:hypothetical protein
MLETAARLRELTFPVMGLVPQPSVEDANAVGIGGGKDQHGDSDLSVSITYTLWRNPLDRADPVNFAELDEQTRVSLEPPPWPRPAWLVAQAERLRYPMLWEAVRTTWHRDQREHNTLAAQLIHHTNYILVNQFREELGLPAMPGSEDWRQVKPSAVNRAATLEVDGIVVPAFEVDTDPFVYAVGVELSPGVAATAVIARDHLPFVRLALTTRTVPD